MTPINVNTLDEWWCHVVDYLNEQKVPFFVHGSTLLQAVRTTNFTERHMHDRELNFGMRAQDVTCQFLNDLVLHFPYVQIVGDWRKRTALIYFGPESIIKYLSINQDQWDMKPGIALIAIFWKTPKEWVEYMGLGACLTWPRKQLDELSVMTINNRQVSVPSDKHEWLRHYFGDDYEVENQGWHWAKDAHNRKQFDDCFKKEDVC